VLYESPHRLAETLTDLAEVCGPERAASVTRELSKMYEETRRGPLAELAAAFASGVRGEIVVVVAGRPDEPEPQPDDFRGMARRLVGEGHGAREIRTLLVQAGLRKNDAYTLALDVTRESDFRPGRLTGEP
jgi:16S rRNA (cytidine1402-2'-O)-methyltransferase